jgi:hypothetical protein
MIRTRHRIDPIAYCAVVTLHRPAPPSRKQTYLTFSDLATAFLRCGWPGTRATLRELVEANVPSSGVVSGWEWGSRL